MGDKTRSTSKEKEFVKLCLSELFKDKQFLSTLRDTIAGEVERVFNDKFENMAAQVTMLEDVNKQLSEKCEVLESRCDSLEQYSRRTSIRITGMKECPQSEVEASVVSIIRDKLELDLDSSAVDRCHPVGGKGGGSRSITVKFVSYRHKCLILQNRRKLQGTGLRINEDLTKNRYRLYKKAVDGFGIRSVWTLDGKVFVKIKGKKFPIFSESDIEKASAHNEDTG